MPDGHGGIEENIHKMTDLFVTGMFASLKKDHKINSNPVYGDPSIILMLHILSCTKRLKDIFEQKKDFDQSKDNKDAFATHLSSQLVQPTINSFISSFGKILMDSFTFEPKGTCFSLVPCDLFDHFLALYPLSVDSGCI
jgi:hypothetical protein